MKSSQTLQSSKSRRDQAQSGVKTESVKDQQYSNVPSFLLKTYDIVNDPIYDKIICWNEGGDGFIVKQPNEFAEKILPKFFKHNNFSSFVRQLNMYDFHKTRNNSNEHCFSHNLFKKGQKNMLVDIKRKNTIQNQDKNMMIQAGKYGANNRPIASNNEQTYEDVPDGQYVYRDIGQGFNPNQFPMLGDGFANPDMNRQLVTIFFLYKSFLQLQTIQGLEQNYQHLEDRMKQMEQKNKEYQQTNSNLWQELYKSREREQSLERFFILAFTSLAQANGFSIGSSRDHHPQQYLTTNSNNNNQNQQSNANRNISGSSNQQNEQIVLRSDQSNNEILALINKIINQPGLLSSLLNLSQSGFKSSSQGANLGSQLSASGAGTNSQMSSGLQLLEQLAKSVNGNNPVLKQIQQFINQLDGENLSNIGQASNPSNLNRGNLTLFLILSLAQQPFGNYGGPGSGSQMNNQMLGHNQRHSLSNSNPPSFQRISYPQITNQINIPSPPNMSPNPYAFEDFDKNSFKNLFGRTISEYSFDANPHQNLGINGNSRLNSSPQLHPRLSRTNSLAGSLAASDDASMYLGGKDPAILSDADSDDRRKRLSTELRKAFDQYLTQNQNSQNTFPLNQQDGQRVEFETISSSSKTNRQNSNTILGDLKHEGSISSLGKRKTRTDNLEEPSVNLKKTKKE